MNIFTDIPKQCNERKKIHIYIFIIFLLYIYNKNVIYIIYIYICILYIYNVQICPNVTKYYPVICVVVWRVSCRLIWDKFFV